MRIYEVILEWDIDDYTLTERKAAYVDRDNAHDKLWTLAEYHGIELPYDHDGFTVLETGDRYYIETVETEDE